MPKTGIAKLKGSKAKNPKARVAGSSQVGRFGWRNATHKRRISLPVSRHNLKILRIISSLGFAYLCSTLCIECRSVWIAFVPDHRESVRGGCGRNSLVRTLRKTNIAPLVVRATILDVRHSVMAG